MKRIIYSLYIDIPKEDLDWQPPHHGHTEPKTFHTKSEFQKNWEWLVSKHKEYADSINVEYKFFEYDQSYIDYRDIFLDEYPEITHYNIVNFYKIHLLYELAKEYDEILYLDLDVIPLTTDNFFDAFNLQEKVAIMEGLAPSQKAFPKTTKDLLNIITWTTPPSIRSPCAKYWNAIAMDGYPDCSLDDRYVFNTGIIGISKENLKKLDYFGDFKEVINLMTKIKNDEFWPSNIAYMLGWDNETIWTYKSKLNNIDWTNLGNDWHHFMDSFDHINDTTKFVHVINKHFDFIKEYIGVE